MPTSIEHHEMAVQPMVLKRTHRPGRIPFISTMITMQLFIFLALASPLPTFSLPAPTSSQNVTLQPVARAASSFEPPTSGNFRQIIKTSVNGRFPVVIFESARTGLKVASIQVGGPVVNGYLTLATEAHDDDGLPHTLEHLVFMGSEKYPWKGVLDLLANRCLASGTNAWTDVDHTCYTMTTAGAEGFCNLLPIYLDHILYPTLTDSAFLTEVHHVNGEGEDAGVVYSEMQSRETTGESTIHRELMRALYPGGSGYKSVTGGLVKNLRESTTNAKVRNYHKEFYRPENLWVIVTGSVDPLKILQCIDPIEQKLASRGKNPTPFIRPWMNPVDPINGTVNMEVPYPADDAESGLVYLGWRGPSSMVEQPKLSAMSVLLDYLTDTAISPFQRAFVEVDSPYASKVSYHLSENSVAAVILTFSDVPSEKINDIPSRLYSVLRNLTEETLDMHRMHSILHHKMLDFWATLESDPHSAVAYDLIGFMLYGNSSEDLTFRLNEDQYYGELMKKEPKFWIELLRAYVDQDRPHVIVRGRPSIDLKARLAAEEQERVKQRRQQLSDAGLQDKKRQLETAVQANEVTADPSILKSVPVPNTDTIQTHQIKPYSNFALPTASGGPTIRADAPHFNLNSIPVRMRVDDVMTNFVHLHLVMDTTNMDPQLRLYLPLYLKAITESSLKLPPGIRWGGKTYNNTASGRQTVTVDGDGAQHVPHELVVAQIEAETQSVSAYLGVGGGSVFSAGYFCNYAVLAVQVEMSKYTEGIRWLRDLLYFTYIDPDRIQVVASKLAQGVSQRKRRGDRVVRALITEMDYVRESNHWAVSMVRQQNLLQEVSQNLSKALNSTDANQALAVPAIMEMKRLQKFLVENTGGFLMHMSTDLDRLYAQTGNMPLEKPWADTILPYFEQNSVAADKENYKNAPSVVSDWMMLAPPPFGGNSATPNPMHSVAVGMGSVDSAYLFQTAQTEVRSYTHPDYPPLMLFLQYLEQLEGPIWRAVRGQGLSYSYYFNMNAEEGLVLLYLGRSSQVTEAYKVTEKIVREHLADNFKVDPQLLESAKSSLIFGLIEKEQSISDLVSQALLSSFRGIPVNYSKTMIDKIWKVSAEEMLASGRKHLGPLFNPSFSRCAIVCNSGKLSEIVSAFSGFGRALKAYESVDASFLNQS